MHKSAFFRIIVFAALLVFSSAGLSAQSKIDKLIEELESKSDVETTYTEHRTRSKKKLYKISRVLTFTDDRYYTKAQKAFESERANSISAVKQQNLYSYKFSDKNGTCSYTLTKGKPVRMGPNKGTCTYTLVMAWKSRNADEEEDNNDMSDNTSGNSNEDQSDMAGIDGIVIDSDGTVRGLSTSDPDGLEELSNLGELADLSKLGELGILANLDKFKNLDEVIDFEELGNLISSETIQRLVERLKSKENGLIIEEDNN